uniref:Putative focal adhesion adaptor protein paxillin n=1 Tax=Xenopsylla cheopis TaxID=163159 RepID=A0A6M2DE51_XENCH
MDPLEEQLAALQRLNNAELQPVPSASKKIAPAVPPKPKKNSPQIPKSCSVRANVEPSFSTLLKDQAINSESPLYTNLQNLKLSKEPMEQKHIGHGIYNNSGKGPINSGHTALKQNNIIYSNVAHNTPMYSNIPFRGYDGEDLPPPPLNLQDTKLPEYGQDEDLPPPPSPVSSSYSELRRATDTLYQPLPISQFPPNHYGTYIPESQSSTYESIYEPINTRPPSQMSSNSNFYSPYVSGTQTLNKDYVNTPKESEVDTLTDLLVQSLNTNQDCDVYGTCIKCGEQILGENSGCTAMDQVYHISCFTCCQCAINLQGKPFYSLDGNPYCEEDYLNTLEKCSVCMKPILDRILRATGKPYHPSCFTCIVCGKSLDGIPFTVDATNQIHCIEDFHKKFAPRCCVCLQPIMPEPGQDETVRVVALDRSFHVGCYKCEDCGLVLSSEAEGRGCYPLDDHVLCKSCNAKRVQTLTTHMTTDL